METIAWERFGIEQVMLARNGLEAVRIAVSERPEIVLTDIAEVEQAFAKTMLQLKEQKEQDVIRDEKIGLHGSNC